MDLVFSDIHADIKALETILQVATNSEFEKKHGIFSRILNLGDVLERGTHPKEVLAKLESLSSQYDVESVMGNHDEAHLYGKKVSGSSLESLDAHLSLKSDDLKFFKENSDGTFSRHEYVDTKNNIICVHGGVIDPKTIIPKDVGDESWFYQKTWQRLSEEDFEFFSYSGYHYKASTAFLEAKKKLENFIIFCGHQHMEAVIEEDNKKISNILPQIKTKKEKISDIVLHRKEIPLEPKKNYIIRLGLGGPEGYYGTGLSKPHFGIINHDSKTVNLFSIE